MNSGSDRELTAAEIRRLLNEVDGDADVAKVKKPRRSDPLEAIFDEDEELDPDEEVADSTIRSVTDILRMLKSGPPDDEIALKHMRNVRKEWIPELIDHLESKEKTRIYEVMVPAYHGEVVVIDTEDDSVMYYFVKGMGTFAFDDVSTGKLTSRRGFRVVFRVHDEGFPLGVVLRAALLNRFRSPLYPDVDDKKLLRLWWKQYFERTKVHL